MYPNLVKKSNVMTVQIKSCSTVHVCLPTLLYVRIAVCRAIDQRRAMVPSHVYMVSGIIQVPVKKSSVQPPYPG